MKRVDVPHLSSVISRHRLKEGSSIFCTLTPPTQNLGSAYCQMLSESQKGQYSVGTARFDRLHREMRLIYGMHEGLGSGHVYGAGE